MKLKLLKPYTLHAVGDIVEYPEAIANLLIERGTAVEVKAQSPARNKSESHRKPHRNK